MSGKRVKRLRRTVKKQATAIRKDYVEHLKKMSMAERMRAAWQIIGGRKWQGELFRYFCFSVLITSGYGTFKLLSKIDWAALIERVTALL